MKNKDALAKLDVIMGIQDAMNKRAYKNGKIAAMVVSNRRVLSVIQEDVQSTSKELAGEKLIGFYEQVQNKEATEYENILGKDYTEFKKLSEEHNKLMEDVLDAECSDIKLKLLPESLIENFDVEIDLIDSLMEFKE